jgi:hypothetical protein
MKELTPMLQLSIIYKIKYQETNHPYSKCLSNRILPPAQLSLAAFR